jgi:hypothetical protein
MGLGQMDREEGDCARAQAETNFRAKAREVGRVALAIGILGAKCLFYGELLPSIKL